MNFLSYQLPQGICISIVHNEIVVNTVFYQEIYNIFSEMSVAFVMLHFYKRAGLIPWK